MRRLRLLGAGVLVAAAVGAGAVAPASPAAATSFLRAGWWNAANTGTVAPPAPPDVPDGGLSLQGGPTPPGAAFGAVAYDLDSSETPATLKLKIAGTPTPNAAVKACVIPSGEFPSGGNQPASAAPTYDCDHPAIPGTITADGLVAFDLSRLATTGRVALAILAVGPTDRVATERPDSSSLETRPVVVNTQDSSAPAGSTESSDYSTSTASLYSSDPSTGSASASAYD